jgi:hypothetical protein
MDVRMYVCLNESVDLYESSLSVLLRTACNVDCIIYTLLAVIQVRFNGTFLYVEFRGSLQPKTYNIYQLITIVTLVETLQFANAKYP